MANDQVDGFQSLLSKPEINRLSIVFLFFVFVAFVGLTPFASRFRLEDLAETGEGDLLRQLTFLVLLVSMVLLTYLRRRSFMKQLPKVIPVSILIVLGWCCLTLFWSPVPQVGFRRLLLTALVIFLVFSFVEGLGPYRTLRLLALSLFVFIIVSLLSGLVVPNAVHLPGERDEALVGAWRGIFFHKNHAGVIAAVFIIFSFFFWRLERRAFWLIAMLGGIFFLVLTRSKTSLGLVAPVIIIGYFFEKYNGSESHKALLMSMILAVIGFIAIILVAFNEYIIFVLSDPLAFTGRVAIWQTLSQLIADNMYGGVGYGSIYHVGDNTQLLSYADGWISFIAHGHNGYLDVTASIGVIGGMLSLLAFVIIPLRNIVKIDSLPGHLKGLLLSLICFAILHNFFESSMLDRDRALWVLMLLVIAVTAKATGRFSLRLR